MEPLQPWVSPAVVIAVVLFVWRRLETRLDRMETRLDAVSERLARLEGAAFGPWPARPEPEAAPSDSGQG